MSYSTVNNEVDEGTSVRVLRSDGVVDHRLKSDACNPTRNDFKIMKYFIKWDIIFRGKRVHITIKFRQFHNKIAGEKSIYK